MGIPVILKKDLLGYYEKNPTPYPWKELKLKIEEMREKAENDPTISWPFE